MHTFYLIALIVILAAPLLRRAVPIPVTLSLAALPIMIAPVMRLAAADPVSDLFTFDLSPYVKASAGGIPILFVVIGLTSIVKEMGVGGKALTLTALGIGASIGVLYEIAALGLPADFNAGFAYGIFGLGLGLLSAKTYDLSKALIEKAVTALLGNQAAALMAVLAPDKKEDPNHPAP
jgi:hypothetical protein